MSENSVIFSVVNDKHGDHRMAQEVPFPDLPVIILVHNRWTLSVATKDKPGYIGQDGETVFDPAQAAQAERIGDMGRLLVTHENFGRDGVYYQPIFHARNDDEMEVLRTWTKATQG